MPVLHPGTGQRRTARRRLHHTKTRHNLSKRALRGCPIEYSEHFILCPRKNPKIQESCKNKAIRRTGVKGQLKNARRNKKRLGFNLPPPSLCFFGFSNGLSIHDSFSRAGGT